MPYLGISEKQRLDRVQIPDHEECVRRVREYIAVSGMTSAEFAERTGKGQSSVNIFIQGRWKGHTNIKDWRYLAAHFIEFIERHPVQPFHAPAGELYETENYRHIATYFGAAVERSQIALIYGPPGTQKSFTLAHLIAARNRAGQNDAFYVYVTERMSASGLLQRIGRAAGVLSGWYSRHRILDNLIFNLRQRQGRAALVLDEAQHLTLEGLEIARELHDQGGCGLVLSGSHNLLEKFLRDQSKLEQWISRQDHKKPLPGLLEPEIRAIAERELGRVPEKAMQILIDGCRADDIYARDPETLKPAPRKYYSVRRLVKQIEQFRAAKGQKERVA